MKATLAVKLLRLVVLSLALSWLTGCAAPKPIDWNSRVGSYTYQQAVAEFGQPDRQARLSDGKVVYKWFAQPQVSPTVNSGMSYYGSTGFAAGQNLNSGPNINYLQLTFGTNGVLSNWSKNH